MQKRYSRTALILLIALCLTGLIYAETSPFAGRWALYVPDGASWLQVEQKEGYLDAQILWYGGSVVPVAGVLQDGETLIVTRLQDVVREKDTNGKPLVKQTFTNTYKFQMVGQDALIGKAVSYNWQNKLDTTPFYGKRIPDLPPAPNMKKLKFGKAVKLFNGKDLSGWELTNPDAVNGFKVVDGALLNDPVQEEGKPHVHYGNLRTVDTFEDFNLKLQVNIPKGSNSGIYLRGIYEVQVFDSYGKDLDSHNMGAIYSRITPSVAAEKPAGEWQDVDITLCDRHVTVILNGQTIIDNQPLMGVTGGALTPDEFSPGPIYLQGDHGKVMYRNMVLKPIKKQHHPVLSKERKE